MVTLAKRPRSDSGMSGNLADDLIFNFRHNADPLGFAGEDANLTRYVGNAPTQYTDPTGLARGVANIDIFTNDADLPDDVIAELNRIFANVVRKCGAGPGFKIFVYQHKGTGPLGFFDPVPNPSPQGYTGPSQDYGVNVRNGKIPNQGALAIEGEDVITYDEQRVRDTAADLHVPYNKALAAVLAHEIGHHAIAGKTAHPYAEGYIDARKGKVGGDFSPETCRAIVGRFGFPVGVGKE
jgi:hypothetical protein